MPIKALLQQGLLSPQDALVLHRLHSLGKPLHHRAQEGEFFDRLTRLGLVRVKRVRTVREGGQGVAIWKAEINPHWHRAVASFVSESRSQLRRFADRAVIVDLHLTAMVEESRRLESVSKRGARD